MFAFRTQLPRSVISQTWMPVSAVRKKAPPAIGMWSRAPYSWLIIPPWVTTATTAFGSFSDRILRSADAKRVYTYVTAAVLREKEYIMGELTDIREDCEDIVADAKEWNECYAEERNKVIEDHARRTAAEKAAEAKPEEA